MESKDLQEFKTKYPKLFKSIHDQGKNETEALHRRMDAVRREQEHQQVEKDPSKGTEAQWTHAWDTDAELRAEFGQDRECFFHYCRAQANGQIKIIKGNCRRYTREGAL
jgi:hypothetical protein